MVSRFNINTTSFVGLLERCKGAVQCLEEDEEEKQQELEKQERQEEQEQ